MTHGGTMAQALGARKGAPLHVQPLCLGLALVLARVLVLVLGMGLPRARGYLPKWNACLACMGWDGATLWQGPVA